MLTIIKIITLIVFMLTLMDIEGMKADNNMIINNITRE